MTIKIKIEQLESLYKLLIDKAKNDGLKDIEIETDYYWLITSDVWDDFNSNRPPQPVVGSLIDDWESLEKIVNKGQIVTYLDYERFASILRAISETIAPSKDISF